MRDKYKLKDESEVINVGIPNIKTIARKKRVIQFFILFTVALFFFNFFTISCNNKKVVTITGINLVTGTNVSDQLENKILELTDVMSFDEEGNIENTFSKEQQQEVAQIAPNFFAILAFVFLLIPFFILFFRFAYADAVVVISLLIAFLSLSILGLSFGNHLINQSNEFLKIVITNNFTYWFTLLMTAINLYICFIMYRYDLY